MTLVSTTLAGDNRPCAEMAIRMPMFKVGGRVLGKMGVLLLLMNDYALQCDPIIRSVSASQEIVLYIVHLLGGILHPG